MLINNWYVVGDRADVSTDHPLKVRLLGDDLVIFQNEQGKMHCLSDRCIHRGASLSQGQVQQDCLACPYHGWRYDGTGRCVTVPAHPELAIPDKFRVDSYPVAEHYGWIWVYFGDRPETERPPIPEIAAFADPQRRTVRGTFLWQANYERVIENGVDFAHAAFVHPSFGDRDRPQLKRYEVTTSDWSARAEVAMCPPPFRGIWAKLRKGERADVLAAPAWHIAGLCIELQLQITPSWNSVLLTANTPIDQTTTLTHWLFSRNFFLQPFFDGDTCRRNLKIFQEDHAILQQLQPQVSPRDLAYSVPSDALAIAFRQRQEELYQQGWKQPTPHTSI
jgi:phenylpropionate dioxygenase-like ring-hydroxylating dioxygenase large terminal subunit